MRNKLKSLIEDNTTQNGKIFDYFIQLLILISLITVSIETLPDNSIQIIKVLSIIEILCISIFTIEYILRIYVSEKPVKYIFNFYGIISNQLLNLEKQTH